MQGRRVYENEEGQLWLKPGDYGKDARTGHWMARPPKGHTGDLCNHSVVEHEDGTITVVPSILIHGETTWHGYLEKGVWREC